MYFRFLFWMLCREDFIDEVEQFYIVYFFQPLDNEFTHDFVYS